MRSGDLDTALDSLAAQVRSRPPLPLDTVTELLGRVREQRSGDAQTALVEHHLGVALDAAMARADSGVDVGDLYQEASVAVVTAVEDYAARSGDATGLRGYVRRVADLYVDRAVEREQAQRETSEAFLRDTRLLDAAEVEMRHRLGREASAVELAALLGWSEERVAVIGDLLAEARERNDESLVPFLDDLDADAADAGDAPSE